LLQIKRRVPARFIVYQPSADSRLTTAPDHLFIVLQAIDDEAW
jgi:hypothetical protein